MYTEYAPLIYNPITIFPREDEEEVPKPISYEDLTIYLGLNSLWVFWLITPMILITGLWLFGGY